LKQKAHLNIIFKAWCSPCLDCLFGESYKSCKSWRLW